MVGQVGLSISLSRSHEKHKDVFNFLLYMDGCVRCFHSMHGLPEGSRIWKKKNWGESMMGWACYLNECHLFLIYMVKNVTNISLKLVSR